MFMKYSIALTLVKGLSPKILNQVYALDQNEKELFETPHHCSHFNMDEKALLIGSSVYLNLIDNIMGI